MIEMFTSQTEIHRLRAEVMALQCDLRLLRRKWILGNPLKAMIVVALYGALAYVLLTISCMFSYMVFLTLAGLR